MTRICVIGGGLGGLTAARALVAAGHEVVVREATPHAGGVVGTSVVDGFVREHAASSFLGGPPHGALALCAELGVAVDKASPRAKRRWIFIDGKLRPLPTGPIELARSDLLTWRGKLDVLREPLRAGRDAAIAGDESVHAFAARRFGAEAARAIVAPFVTGVFAADAHDISLAAGFPRLAALDAHGGIVRGMVAQLARRVSDRVRGRRAEAPATARGLWAPRGGLGALIDALTAELGARIRYGAPVRSLAPDGAGDGVIVDGERFGGAVLAIPAQDAPPLVAGLPVLASRLAAFERAPSALVYLGYPAAAVPVDDGFGFLVAQGEELRVLGVVFESVVWPDRAPAGQVLLRCVLGGDRDRAAAALGDEALIAHARADVGRALGVTAAPVHQSVMRWDRGVARYGVGHHDKVREAVSAAREHRIALAGADYRGPGVNDVCADAAVVVEDVRGWR